MTKIRNVRAHEILDSRGNPTVEAIIECDEGTTGVSSVPSGISKSKYEAFELKDLDKNRYGGMGVLKAVENINNIIGPQLVNFDVIEQQMVDKKILEIDATPSKEKLGSNATLAVSQAVLKAAANSEKIPLFTYVKKLLSGESKANFPTPIFNLIEGGKHGGNALNFQEFLLIPASSKEYAKSLEMAASVYRYLKTMIFERGESVLVAEEGGFSPNLSNNQSAIALLKDAIEGEKYSFSLDAFVGLDIAANTFYSSGRYKLADRAIPYGSSDFTEFLATLTNDYSIIYLEDPMAEEDLEGWKNAYSILGDKTLIAGDDLITTNPYRLQIALDNKVVSGVVIKPNQIGTITETLAVVEIAKFKGLKTIVSHRSSETMDSFIADFAVGIGADYVKFGAPARERVVKYNRLLQIDAIIKESSSKK